MAIIKRKVQVTMTIDTDKAHGWQNGHYNMDAYPNFDINYCGKEDRFIDVALDELSNNFQYSGMSISIKDIK